MVTLTKQFARFGREAMTRSCLCTGPRPASPALLSGNSRLEKFFLDVSMWQVAGHVSQSGLLGSDGASLRWPVGDSEDPIGYSEEDANLYRYCANNAVVLVDPSGLKFIDFGMVGEDAIYWAGGNGAKGRQRTIERISPEYESRTSKTGGCECWVKAGAGLFEFTASYRGVKAGFQGATQTSHEKTGKQEKTVISGEYYLSNAMVGFVNEHEQRHIDKTSEIYSQTMEKAEEEVESHREKSPLTSGKTEAACIAELRKRIDWDNRLKDFLTRNAAANRPGGTLDQADRGKYKDYGARRLEVGDTVYVIQHYVSVVP